MDDTTNTDPLASSIDDFVAQRAQNLGRLRVSAEQAAATPAQKAAQLKYLSDVTGLPPAVVETNEGEAKARAKFEELRSASESSPILRARLMDPNFAKLAQDDAKPLSLIESTIRALGAGVVDQTVGTGLSGTGRLLEIAQRNLLTAFSTVFLPKPTAGGEATSESLIGPLLGADWRQAGDALKKYSRENIDIPVSRQNWGYQVAKGVGQVTGQIALHYLTGGTLTAPSLYTQGADVIGEKIDKDPNSQALKDIATLGGAAVTALTEKYALDTILGPLAVPIKNAIAAATARIGVAAIAEGGQEIAENIGHDILRKVLTNPDAKIEMGQALEEGSVGAAVGGIIRTMVESALHVKVRDHQRRVDDAKREIEELQRMFQVAGGTNLFMHDRASLADFVQAAADANADRGAPTSAWIDGRVLADTLAQAGVDEVQLGQILPSVASQLQDAVAANSPVEIPIGELAAALPGTPLEQALVPNLRMKADGMSLNEAKEEQAQAQQFLEQETDRILQQASNTVQATAQQESVRQRIKADLDATGRFSSDVNDKGARLVAQFYTVMAARMNTTADQLYTDYQNRVKGQGQQAGALNAQEYQAFLERTPEVKEALQKLRAGEITAADYDAIVAKHRPVFPYLTVPRPATREEMLGALHANKRETVGAPSATLENGHPVGLRLDIPAYSEHGVWVPTIHERGAKAGGAGKKIGHESTAVVNNARFSVHQNAATAIAEGNPKGTIATVEGEWENVSPEEAVRQAEAALRDPAWVQVGMDPFRHSFFYDRDSMTPVVSAERVLQIGPLVLAKNPVYGNREDFLYESSGEQRKLGQALDLMIATMPPPPSASRSDFSKENVGNILSRSNWAILTAANPMAQQLSPEENAQRMAQLRADLEEMGLDYVESVGRYGNVEPSFIVFDISREQAVELGQKYGQDSVLTREGLVYHDGRVTPSVDVETFDTPPEDYYTEIPNSGVYFSVGLDFDATEDATGALTQRDLPKKLLGTPRKPQAIPVRVDQASDIANARQIATSQKWATNRDFKLALQAAVRAATKSFDLTQDTPAVRDYLVRQILKEAREALVTNSNAVGWYDDKVTTALEVISEIHPEIKTDEQSRFAFVWALAVTSNGVKVDKNFELAERAYNEWKRTGGPNGGRFPTQGIGVGTAASKIHGGLGVYNDLIQKWGYDRFKAFSTTLQPNRNVKATFGRAVSGEGMDTMVYGAGIVGPKIGNGFFMNLYGEFGQLTMDRWWVRMWGRMIGNLVENDRTKITESRTAFLKLIDLIKTDKDATRAVEAAIGARLQKGDPVAMAKLLMAKTTDKPVRDALENVLPATPEREAAARQLRGKLKDFVSIGDELRKAAKAFYDNLDGQIEVPGGSRNRDMMRAVSERVLAELQKDNPDLTMADFQALMWYPEKTLYDTAGAAQDVEGEEGYSDDEAPDYANAAVALARSKGVSNEQIEAAVGRARSDIQARQRAGRGGRATGSLPAQAGEGARADAGAVASATADVLNQDLVGTHFSRSPRTFLDGRMHGTGLQGAERDRLKSPTDARLKDRIYFYVDEGTGIVPEPGVGAYAHRLNLTRERLYDISKDPLNLRQAGQSINDYESAILDAGFDGYYTPQRLGDSKGGKFGVGVLIGKASHAVPAVQLPAGVTTAGTAENQTIAAAKQQEKPVRVPLTIGEGKRIDEAALKAAAPSSEIDYSFIPSRPTYLWAAPSELAAARATLGAQGIEMPGVLEQSAYHGTPHRGITQFSTTLDAVRSAWDAAGIKNSVNENNGVITVSQIVVPKDQRGKGAGTAAMQALIDYADQTGQRIALSPSTDFGASSKDRLVKFYKRFGFVENKGRNKDFRISESMIREPQGIDMLAQPADNGPRGTYDISSMTTVLNDNANLSTFLHETGHFFLDAIRRMVASGQATPEIVEMYRGALKGLGVTEEQWEQWHEEYAATGKISSGMRAAHEQWARTFEHYLFNGKAPNVEMRSLFRTFAEWLKRVYTSMRDFATRHGTTLDPDLTAVMDKMLATDEEIAEAEQLAGLLPDLDATGEAQEKLNARKLRDLQWAINARNKMIAKLQKEAAAQRKEVEDEVRAEVEQMPLYRALRWIKKGELTTDAGEEIKATKGHKLNTEALAEMYPDGMLGRPDLTKLRGMTSSTGLHPDLIADMIPGWEGNGDQLVRALIDAEPIGSVIEGITDQRMLERYGDLASPEAIAQAATEAVHNEARAKVLATELAAQREMLNARQDTGEKNAKGNRVTVNVLVQAAKQFAENVIGRRQIKDLKKAIWAHTQAERRAGREWEAATAKGDTQAAVQAKQDQMLNNAAVRAGQEALEKIAKAREFFKRVSRGSAEKLVERGYDPDIVSAARAILAAYGVAERQGKTAEEYLEAVRTNDPATYNAVAPSIAAAMRVAKPFDQLTVGELEALQDEIGVLWHMARRSRQMEVDGDLLDREEVQDELKDDLEARGIPDTMPGDTSAMTPSEQAVRKLLTFRSAMTRAENWAQNLGAKFTRFVFQPIKEAADRYRIDKSTYLTRYRELLDSIAPSLKKREIAAPELGYTFGKDTGGVAMGEILHAILHTGNESNKRKLLLGRKWATENEDGTLDTSRWDAFVARMISEGTLTKAHFDFAQGVWDLLESMKPLAQKAHRDAFGRYFAEVTADAFDTPFGQYRGGYVPAIADSRIVSDAATRKLAEDENESLAFAFPATNRGFTKGRVEYNRPLLLDLRLLSQHMDKVLLFSHLEMPVRDVRRVLTAKGVAYGLNRIDPTGFDNVVTPWLNRAARQQVETPVAGDAGLMRILSAARQRAGLAAMFANASNAAQQITGFSLAALRVKPAHLLSASAQMIAHPKQTKQAVADASIYMKERMENEAANAERAITEILLDPSVYDRAKNWSSKHAYFLQQAIDNSMGPIIWTAAFNQATEQGLAQKDAVRFADSVIRTTQGSTLPEDVSRIEGGNAFVRLFTQFAGYFNMQANLLGTEFAKVAREMGVKKGAGRMLYITTLGFLAPAWVAEAIAQAFRGGPDDDDKDGQYLDDWLAAVFGWGTIRASTALVPVVGQGVNTVANSWNSKPYDDRMASSPSISMIESAVRAPHSVYEAIANDGKRQKAVRDVAALITMTTGLPASAVARPLGYLAGVSDYNIRPTGAGDMARGLITGAASPQSK